MIKYLSNILQMNAHSLSVEFAPLLIWQKGDPGTNSSSSHSRKKDSNSKSMEFAASHTAVNDLSGNIFLLLIIKLFFLKSKHI